MFTRSSWSGDVPAVLRRGVRVLQIFRDGTAAHVFPPGRIVEIRRYKSRRGTRRTFVAVELPKRARRRALSSVIRKIGTPATILTNVKTTRRLTDMDLIYKLGQLWSSAVPSRMGK